MQKLGTLLSLTIISLAAAFVLTTRHAAAAPEYCFMLGDPANGSTAANACLAGQAAPPELHGLSGGMSSSALRSTFINDIKSYANKPYPVDRVGAAYVVAQLQQRGGNWETNLGLTTLTVENIPASAGCANTAYDPASNSVVHISDCQHDAALVARQNGAVVFAIRITCGNVLGSFPGPAPDRPPTGSLSLSCDTNGTGVIRLTFSDPDGNTSARLTVTYAGGSGGSFNYGSSGAYTRTITAAQANGSWRASLLVQDAGGSQDRTFNASAGTCNKPPTGSFGAASCNGNNDTYTISATFNDPNGPTSARIMGNNGTSYGGTKSGTSATWTISTSSMPRAAFPAKLQVNDYVGGATNTWVSVSTLRIPNCPPKGSISGTSCTSVRLKLWDPNAPGSSIQYYLALNGGSQQGPFTFGGGENGGAITQNISSVAGFDYWIRNQVTLYGVDTDAGSSHVAIQSATLPSICDSLKCSTSDLPATGIVAGESYTFHVNVQIVGPGLVGPRNARFSSVRVGSLNTSRGYTPASGSAVLENASPDLVFTPTASGTYSLTWVFSGGEANPASTTCGKSVQVGYAPFFTVEEGDVAAGPGFGSTCNTDDTAGIAASNLGGQTGTGFYGSGSQLGAFASGALSQFATDSTNNPLSDRSVSTNGGAISSAAGLPSGLAFGNSSAAGTTYGGNFNRPNWCVPDYEGAVDTGSVPAFNPGSLTSGVYRVSGSTLPALVIPQGVHVTLIATGNVFLGGNITYDTGYTVSGGDVTQVPQFSLLVKGGNIYIGNTVSTLAGFYDAQPKNGTGGTLYTCASGPGAVYSNDYASCNHQLTVYGGVAASKLNLGRTWGNLVKTGGVDNSPSERIVYTPELWLGNLTGPVCRPDATSLGCLYQAYTALPPVL